MEDPAREIEAVVKSLCQGTIKEQSDTIVKYFTKNAAFVHPFCFVPRFVMSEFRSRDVVRGIFQWYRMMSPEIDIKIDSVLYDATHNRLYLDIRQTFRPWFLPSSLYSASVRLVTILDLVSNNDPSIKMTVARHQQELLSNGDEPEPHDPPKCEKQTWYISKQEDLYQVNEFLKFVGFGRFPFAFMWFLFQMSAAGVCLFMSMFHSISRWAWQRDCAPGGIDNSRNGSGTSDAATSGSVRGGVDDSRKGSRTSGAATSGSVRGGADNTKNRSGTSGPAPSGSPHGGAGFSEDPQTPLGGLDGSAKEESHGGEPSGSAEKGKDKGKEMGKEKDKEKDTAESKASSSPHLPKKSGKRGH